MAVSKFEFANNKGLWFWSQTYVSKDYNPTMGFVYANDIIQSNLEGYLSTRPTWKPKSVRQFDSGASLDMYHRASDGKFQQAELELFPIYRKNFLINSSMR